MRLAVTVAWIASLPGAPAFAQEYAGSAACRTCHPAVYERWKKTRMANVVRDPKEHPDAIAADITKATPPLKREDIAFVYGSRWKQRYFTKVGNDYFPLGAQWDFAHKKWLPYFVRAGTDWWTAVYPADNLKRPTGPLCDGCHSVNYDIRTHSVTEWNVGCERCHGPGAAHAAKPSRANIVNPGREDYVRANDACVQCHSQGRPLTNPIEGRHYDWPVGYDVRRNLSDYWQLEEHKTGETTFTHYPDGTAHKNRMQGNDFVQSAMYTHGVRCFSCHDVHGTENPADLIKPASLLCLQCHGPNSPNGPHVAAVEEHTHHKAGSAGSECIACHMPKMQATLPDDFVRSHTFKFVTPAAAERDKAPNACNLCHEDKTAKWATDALMRWRGISPWRMMN